MPRKSNSGRRKVENNEFCVNCKKMHHQKEIESLKDKVEELSELLKWASGIINDCDMPMAKWEEWHHAYTHSGT